MQPISQKPTPQKLPLRFGSASGLNGIPGMVDTAFQLFQNSRGKEMITEDVVGFGVLRTGLDLGRGKLYGGDDSWNVPAGAERFFREITSILTDSILGGVVAWGMGKAIFDRKNKAFSNTFMQYPSLELFQDIVKSERLKSAQTPEAAKAAFIEELSERFEKNEAAPSTIKQALQSAWNYQRQSHTGIKKLTGWFRKNPNQGQFDTEAKNLVLKLNPKATDFGWNIQNGKKVVSFELNDLLDDISQFANHMKTACNTKAPAEGWKELAEAGIKRTLTAKNWKIPVGLAAGMGATFAMPFLSNALTKKAFGIDYFPGEIGFNKNLTGKPQNSALPAKKQSWLERHFPYVNKTTKDGNPWPLIISAVPLIAAVGLLSAKGKPKNIFAGNGTLKKMFDFTKGGPFTSEQQMASMFALLITSRLLCSRSDNEYKERLFDSAGGWAFWILGTPLLKKWASKLAGHKELLTAEGEFKSREAIQHFAPKALKANVLISASSTLATMGIIGIGAPLIGMKLTQANESRKQKKLEEQQRQAAPNTFQPSVPAVQQPDWFGAPANPFNPAQPVMGSFAWQPPQSNRQA